MEVGEPIQVTLTIAGTGNVATLDPPTFEPPGVFERYDPQISTEEGLVRLKAWVEESGL